jgi:hypothetical protein
VKELSDQGLRNIKNTLNVKDKSTIIDNTFAFRNENDISFYGIFRQKEDKEGYWKKNQKQFPTDDDFLGVTKKHWIPVIKIHSLKKVHITIKISLSRIHGKMHEYEDFFKDDDHSPENNQDDINNKPLTWIYYAFYHL